jgi:hypothetical protein
MARSDERDELSSVTWEEGKNDLMAGGGRGEPQGCSGVFRTFPDHVLGTGEFRFRFRVQPPSYDYFASLFRLLSERSD